MAYVLVGDPVVEEGVDVLILLAYGLGDWLGNGLGLLLHNNDF